MSAMEEDVLSALVNLGYQRAAAEHALESAAKDGEKNVTFEATFRNTLAALAK
jgi:Holliday junction resolvasome RuvABC DNA-binding subunit